MGIENYTINLPFKTLEQPSETTLDEHLHELQMSFTLDMSLFDDYPTEFDLQNVIYQCFYDAGDMDISPAVTYFPGNDNVRGVLELFIPANPIPDDRFFTFVYNGGQSQFTIGQDALVPEPVSLSVSSSGPMFPSPYDMRTITMTGGISGVEYSLYRDSEFVTSGVYRGTSLSFGEVNSPGSYFVKRPEGYIVGNSINLSLFDVFKPGTYRISDAVYSPASGNGGYATATLSTNRIPATGDILALQNWFNLQQEHIASWQDFGQHITFEQLDDNRMRVSLLCPPNLSSSSRTFDTGMYISEDGQSTLSFVQEGGGTLMDFNLESTGLNSSGTFDITLSGSQYGVDYSLMRAGDNVGTMKGTGEELTFRNLTKSGVYSVIAEYGLQSRTLVDTYTAVIPDEPGGNNYIAQDTYVGDGSAKITDITYYGGLGYPVQEVRTSFVERGSDLVRGIVYDNMRRPDTKVLLPYTRRGSNSHFEPEHESAQMAYYAGHGFGDGSKAHKINAFESGLSGKQISSMREGNEYHTQNKRVRYTYRLNETADSVAMLRYIPLSGTSSAKIITDGIHVSGNLTVTLTTDEDGRSQEVFRDMNNNVILERRSDDGEDNDTYYVYDIRDSLVCAIQPMGVRSLPNEFSFTSDFAQKWCFTYKYDAAGNLIERHVPGCGNEVMIYDLRGRMVLCSDALQMHNGLYRYYIYDEIDRIVEEGYAKLGMTMTNIRNAMLEGIQISECIRNRVPFRQCIYYSDTTPPEGFSAEPGVVDEDVISDARCVTMLKSETVYVDPTVTSNASTSEVWTRTYFYDCEGRTVQIIETGGICASRYSFAYDFTGNITSYVERHSYGTRQDYLQYQYQYDDRGRRILCLRELNGRQFPPISYIYDELGRITMVQCEGKVDELYSYNLQGWQQTQGVLLYGQPYVFHMILNHYGPESDETTPSYAGFVSEAISHHAGQEPVTTTYRYDDLGRVISAKIIDGVEETVSYDANGNIIALSKTGTDDTGTQISYGYVGNQVVQTDNGGGVSNYSYYQNGNLRSQSGENLLFSYNFRNLLTAVRRNGSSIPLAEVIHLADWKAKTGL